MFQFVDYFLRQIVFLLYIDDLIERLVVIKCLNLFYRFNWIDNVTLFKFLAFNVSKQFFLTLKLRTHEILNHALASIFYYLSILASELFCGLIDKDDVEGFLALNNDPLFKVVK